MSPLDLAPALPELFLALAGLLLLMIGVFAERAEGQMVTWLAILSLAVAGFLVVTLPPARQLAFGGLFVTDGFAEFMKVLILTGGALSLLMSFHYNLEAHIARFEFAILFLFATVGMLIMVSANNLITLYVGLELQSLALYVLAAFKRDTRQSTEAGLKYFVLGALSSGILLFGASFVYGFSGSADFGEIARVVRDQAGAAPAIGILIGIVLLSVGLAFKASAVPFHMWTPDVYQGAPTPVTAFFAAAPKVAALSLFIRVMIQPFGGLTHEWQQIVWFMSAASMVVGAYAAINQTNIKRLMAYSSIGHVGYALMGLAAGTEDGIRGMLIYLGLYIFMTLGSFGVILCMLRKGRPVEAILDLTGLSRTHPLLAAALAVFMFSMAGIPPLAGLLAKWFVFYAAIEAHLYVLAVVGVLSSVVACYYYIRVVKIMYFDEPVDALDRGEAGIGVNAVIALSTAVILFFWVMPAPFMTAAGAAAATLFSR